MREFQTLFSHSVINCASPLFPWTVTYDAIEMGRDEEMYRVLGNGTA